MIRGELLDIFRHGFQAYKSAPCECPYLCGTIENEYWWKGFELAADFCKDYELPKKT